MTLPLPFPSDVDFPSFEFHLFSKVHVFEMEAPDRASSPSASRVLTNSSHCIATKDPQEVLETSDHEGHLSRPSLGVNQVVFSGFVFAQVSDGRLGLLSPRLKAGSRDCVTGSSQFLSARESGSCFFLDRCEKLNVTVGSVSGWSSSPHAAS